MKNKTKFIKSIFSLAFLFLFISCEKDEFDNQGKSTANFNESLTYGTVKDVDGNIYKTIRIGNQIWMAENLRARHFNNGDIIDKILVNGDWNTNMDMAGFGSYEDTNDKDSIVTFGFLYTWYIVNDSRGVCPDGWHIPTQLEWETLIETLGGGIDAELKIVESGGEHWNYMNLGTNSSGFTALPAGQYNLGRFYGIGYWTAWWTAVAIDEQTAFAKEYSSNYPTQIRSFPKHMGLSIRCIKD